MEIKLFNDTNKIINDVKLITGKEIIFKENNSLNTYAIAKIARKSMENHIIYYKAIHNDILNHIIAHECGHMIRTFKEKVNRVMPYSDDEIMTKAIKDIEKNCDIKYPPDIKIKFFQSLINGIVTQITSMPEDVRIEKWIYDNYPKIRNVQKEALKKQENDIIESLKPKVKEMIPDIVYKGSGIINYFFIRSLNKIINSNGLSFMVKTNFFQKAIKLYNEIMEISEEEDSLANSIKISDFLAENLGFKDWFRWKDFEDIPDDYESTIYF